MHNYLLDQKSYFGYYGRMNDNKQIVFTAGSAKNRFGELLDAAQRRPVVIQKHGRDVAVLVSAEEYAHLEALDDAWWGARAKKALKEGTIGVTKSEALLKKLLHAKG